ncbi:MAG: nucleoside deaminase [Gammaproteobacteria bacterium]
MTARQTTAARLLQVIRHDILPLTADGVAKGDKVFGAAVLQNDALVIAATNREHSSGCPLWHGEMAAIADFYQMPRHPAAGGCVFLSTHEPCPMCASALAWAGFGEVYYLFDYADTAEVFDIRHDGDILRELFAPCAGLNNNNRFFRLTAIDKLINGDAALTAQRQEISARYRKLSATYQRGKKDNAIPLK